MPFKRGHGTIVSIAIHSLQYCCTYQHSVPYFGRDGTKIPGLGRLPKTPSDYDVSALNVVTNFFWLLTINNRKKQANVTATKPMCQIPMKSCYQHPVASMLRSAILPAILVRPDCSVFNFSHDHANFLIFSQRHRCPHCFCRQHQKCQQQGGRRV